MPSSIDLMLSKLIKAQFPAADHAADCFLPLSGLSGCSVKVSLGEQTLLARRNPGVQAMPGVNRQREYRILRKLAASGLVPSVYEGNRHWLLLGWQPGEMLSEPSLDSWLEPLVERVALLHRQPLMGYRLQLLPLLWCYWQRSHPSRRHLSWLRALQRLQRGGEPRPLRLVPLHMDIHSGNLLVHQGQLQLIDWEYASDGDAALELAVIVSANGLDARQQQRLIKAYATLQSFTFAALQRQMARWQPWLLLLATSWYELRWQQSGESNFRALADEGWQRQGQMKR